MKYFLMNNKYYFSTIYKCSGVAHWNRHDSEIEKIHILDNIINSVKDLLQNSEDNRSITVS